MANPATVDDIEARWRPLSAQETTNADAFLGDAWALLKGKVPNLDADAISDPDLAANVVRVECAMVLRVLKNPEGTKTTTLSIDDGSRSWTRDDAGSTGLLYVTDEELSSLASDDYSGSFTIRAVAKPFYGPSAEYPCWSPVNPYGSPAC